MGLDFPHNTGRIPENCGDNLKNHFHIFLSCITLFSAVLVLTGYFFEIPFLERYRNPLLDWTSILLAVAVLIGVLNLLIVHTSKFFKRDQGFIYSLVFLLSFLAVVSFLGYFGIFSIQSMYVLNNVQIPIAVGLMILLMLVLAASSLKVLKRRFNTYTVIFLATFMLVMLGSISISGSPIPYIHNIAEWLKAVPAAAGARGILLGVVFGSVTTGLRVVFGPMGSDEA
jgi:hypothetical protein